MMVAWWGYGIAVAAALSVAGWLGARVLRAAGRPGRWAWLATMSISLLWPLLASVGWSPLAPLGRLDLPVVAAVGTGAAGTPVGPVLARVEGFLPWLWLAGSAALLLLGMAGEVGLRRRCRLRVGLPLTQIDVWASSDSGPATFGLLRPRILLPRWVLQGSARERRLVLLHELHHVRAGDVRLLWTAWAMVCAMPWNPAVWWQYRRLRAAVELDCDLRCLRRGLDARRYAETLLRAARERSPRLAPAVGLVERRGLLARRIEGIVAAGARKPRLRHGLALSAIVFLAAAGLFPAPAGSGVFREPGSDDLGTAIVTAREKAAGGVASRARGGRSSYAPSPEVAAGSIRELESAAEIRATAVPDVPVGVVRPRGSGSGRR